MKPAIRKMEPDKATDSDYTSVEVLETFGDVRIDKITA